MVAVRMAEPAAQTDNSLRVSKQHLPALPQALFDLCRQPRCVQEDAAAHLCMIAVAGFIPEISELQDSGKNSQRLFLVKNFGAYAPLGFGN